MLPRQFRDVYQAVHAAEVDESAEVHDAGHDTLADLAGTQVVQEFLALLLLSLLQPSTARQDHVVSVLIQLDDLGVNRGADVGL